MVKLTDDNEEKTEVRDRHANVRDRHANEIDLSLERKNQKQQNEKDRVLLNKNKERFFAIVTIHDVAPEYSQNIFRAADQIEKLGIHYNLAIIPYLKKREDNLITRNPEFVRNVLEYGQEIALHGNYHETNDGKIEDFHTFSIEEAKRHLQNAINTLKEAGMDTTVFVPPTWAINKPTIDDLTQLGFKLVEGKEEILIMDRKKIKSLHAGVLNWDQSGSPEKNKEYLTKNKQLYRLEVIQKNSRLVRIALHPRDPEEALQDQIEMIQGLKDMNYSFLNYDEMIKAGGGEIIDHQEGEKKLLPQNLPGYSD